MDSKPHPVTLIALLFVLFFIGTVILTLIRIAKTDTVRSVKVENNTVTTQNVKISADVLIQDKDTKVRVYTPDIKRTDDYKSVPKPNLDIDWASKPKVLGGLGAQINGREAEELFK
jgi:hypothetical protein